MPRERGKSKLRRAGNNALEWDWEGQRGSRKGEDEISEKETRIRMGVARENQISQADC